MNQSPANTVSQATQMFSCTHFVRVRLEKTRNINKTLLIILILWWLSSVIWARGLSLVCIYN